MAETPAPPAPAPPAAPEPAPTPPPAQPPSGGIPKDRFDEVNKAKNEAEAEVARLRAEAQAREDAEKTELQKAQDTAAREKAAREAAEGALAKTQRDGALRTAAQAAGAISPDAIVALANERGVQIDPAKPESAAEAVAAMKGTAEQPGADAALFGDGTVGQPQAFGVPSTPPPPGSTAPAPSDDPKGALGQGLLASMARGGLIRQ